MLLAFLDILLCVCKWRGVCVFSLSSRRLLGAKKKKKKKKEANGPDYFASSFIYSFLSVVSPDFIFLFYSLSAFYVGCNRNFLSFPWSRPPPIFFFIIISANIFFVSLLVNKMTKLKTWKGINFF